MQIRKLFLALLIAAAPIVAFADTTDNTDDTTNLPEPATLALLGIGAVAFVIARVNKRK